LPKWAKTKDLIVRSPVDMSMRRNMTDNNEERRHLSLTQAERGDLVAQRQIEEAVSYFLDLDTDRTVKQIAQEMGLSVSALKRLTQKPEFQAVYDEALMQLGHHPRLQALSANLPELLPLAYNALKGILVGQRVAATAKVQAIKLLFDTVGVGKQVVEEDPAALNNFLKGSGVTVQGDAVVNVNLPIPDEYREAFQRLMGVPRTHILEGVVCTPDTPGPSRDDEPAVPLLSPEVPASSLPDEEGAPISEV
jgi:hypothetical protein